MNLVQTVIQAQRAFDCVAEQPWCVKPSVPILFFGDVTAYRDSPLRVLTVGLNPSLIEFPAEQPFRRFPILQNNANPEPHDYLAAMSDYFRAKPYSRWFNAFEPLLNGMNASYYGHKLSTALHTDLCSPIATDPTWSKLDKMHQAALQTKGIPLWHKLLQELQPQVIIVSIARKYLDYIGFESVTDWKIIHTFGKSSNGDILKQPHKLWARWYRVGNKSSAFFFGRAAQTPFGLMSNSQKQESGQIFLEIYHDGP